MIHRLNHWCNVRTGTDTKNPRSPVDITIPNFKVTLAISEAEKLAEALLEAVAYAKAKRGDLARAEDPEAKPREWAELWTVMREIYDRKGMEWVLTTQEQYYAMLGAVPPRIRLDNVFLCGEPWNTDDRGDFVYAAFRNNDGKVHARYMTERQFRENIQGYPKEVGKFLITDIATDSTPA